MVFSKRFRKIWNAAASLTTGGVPAPPLSYEEAIAIFDQLAARDDLALGYPHEACFARNHMMCEAALKAGFMPKKAWAIDEEGKPTLVFKMPDGERVQYWCHTAMVLPVKTPNGEIHDLVFDPLLFDGPVLLKEWGETIKARPNCLEITRLGIPPTRYLGDYNTLLRTSKALSDPTHERHPLQTIRLYQPLEIVPRIVFASQYCRDYIFPALEQWPERQGNGWISIDPFPKPSVQRAALAPRDTPSGSPGVGG